MSPKKAFKSQAEAAEEMETAGWTLARITKNGYYLMRCPCGDHQGSLHKTPSNTNHWKEKVAHMLNECPDTRNDGK